MGWLSSFLHPEKGYKKGQEQLDRYFQQAQAGMAPYSQHGQEQYGNINSAIGSLMDPAALQAKWTQGYQESPSAIQAEKMAQERGLNAASGMGLLGSNSALHAIQSGTSQIGMNDRQQYLDDLMKKYLSGTGLAQNIYGTGANMASGMGTNAMNMGQNSANMAYGAESAPGNMLSNILGRILPIAGGFALGGAPGAAAGAGMGNKWSLKGGNYGS